MASFPTCQICRQQFSLKGPAPFLLPCLHDVCQACVTEAGEGVLSCSTCQRDVNLTETPLQKDVITEKEILHLTVNHNPELVLCTHEEDGNQAVCWCEDCEDFFCENCQMVHNSFKISRKHTVQNIEDLKAGSLHQDRYCSIHPKFITDTWDKDCCMLTCGTCRRTDHVDHKVVYVDETADSGRKEVETLQRDVTASINTQEDHLAATVQDLSSSEQTYDMLPDKISHTFHSLNTLIDQREKEMQIELQQHKEKVLGDLKTRKNTSENNLQRCQTTSDYIKKTLQYGSLHDILELRRALEEKSQDCRRSAPSEDFTPLPLPVFNTGGLEKIKSTLTQFGNIATEIDQSEAEEAKTNEELTQELQKMTEEMSLLQLSNEKLIKQQEKAKESENEAVMLKQELKQLRSYLDKVICQEQEAERVSGFYRLRPQSQEESFLLICTNIHFSRTKYNAEHVQINAEGELINKSEPNPQHSDQRLKKYWGTSSTAPLSQCGSPQYFEVESQVGIEETLTETDLLLEIGLAREEEQDQHHWIAGQPHSYSLIVLHCTTHGSICRSVWRHGEYLTCLSDTLENTPGTSATLHYGVVYDSARSRIAFIDVNHGQIIGKIENVDSSVALWPMFGVYCPTSGKIRMSLIVGNDIDMNDENKALILDCLT